MSTVAGPSSLTSCLSRTLHLAVLSLVGVEPGTLEYQHLQESNSCTICKRKYILLIELAYQRGKISSELVNYKLPRALRCRVYALQLKVVVIIDIVTFFTNIKCCHNTILAVLNYLHCSQHEHYSFNVPI